MTNIIERKFVEDTYEVDIDRELGLLDTSKRSSDIIEYKFKKPFEGLEDKVNNIYKNIDSINNRLEEDIGYLSNKIEKAVEKLRGAILVERNTTTAIYTTTIPLDTYNTDTTTATIKDNIVFGISDSKVASELVTPLKRQDVSFKNLVIKNLTNSEELKNIIISDKTTNNTPLEFSIDLRGRVQTTSSIILDLEDLAILEIYIDGNLYKEKTLDSYFNIPININNSSISFRSYPTIHKSSRLRFNVIGITGYTSKDASMYESKPLNINKNLSKIVIDTCDNNTDNNINIEYFISVNDNEYEKLKAVSKNRRKHPFNLQSILTLSKDTDISMEEMFGNKKSEGDIRYYIPDDLQNVINYETTLYTKDNLNYLDMYIQVVNDITLHKSIIKCNTAYIDEEECKTDLIYLPKGIRRLRLDTCDEVILKQLLSGIDVFSSILTKTIYKDTTSNKKYISCSTSEMLSIFNSTSPGSFYIKGSKSSIYVNTIKIKAILNSLDNKTIPYIDRVIVRGL